MVPVSERHRCDRSGSDTAAISGTGNIHLSPAFMAAMESGAGHGQHRGGTVSVAGALDANRGQLLMFRVLPSAADRPSSEGPRIVREQKPGRIAQHCRNRGYPAGTLACKRAMAATYSGDIRGARVGKYPRLPAERSILGRYHIAVHRLGPESQSIHSQFRAIQRPGQFLPLTALGRRRSGCLINGTHGNSR